MDASAFHASNLISPDSTMRYVLTPPDTKQSTDAHQPPSTIISMSIFAYSNANGI